jgi:hypothetical protein
MKFSFSGLFVLPLCPNAAAGGNVLYRCAVHKPLWREQLDLPSS